MTGMGYWITRYLLASGILFIILALVELSKGTPSTIDLLSALAWSLVASAIFIGSKYWRARKQLTCTICTTDKPNSKS
ncbi:hypothetical protein [Janthinobacterium agaricidamnosum]|uniref:Putative membrane protein n=1 Tax=Janthinobacterium agaricidamnosum NBRC 102515 = DSM 9628 TaxID=1349767 RepID=W0V2G7_9BURK|nr:hypothetical protein [Janthinobacterium agaricidamnosum]CDG83009.1 putative membrane protein [Janthinobacterium agaricidamnosum NBRC 102515 = DSM 9628]